MNHHFIGPIRHFFLLVLWALAGAGLQAQASLPDSLPLLDSLPDEQIQTLLSQLYPFALEFRDTLAVRRQKASALADSLKLQLQTLRADTSENAKTAQKALKSRLQDARNVEKDAIRLEKKARTAAGLADKMATLTTAENRKNLPRLYGQLIDLRQAIHPQKAAETPIAEILNPPPVDSAAPPDAPLPPAAPAPKPVRRYDPAKDVTLHPPQPPCGLAVDRRDDFSGETIRETDREELFRFTNPALRAIRLDNNHVTAEASLAQRGANFLFVLNLTVRDPNARKTFGSLQRNSQAVLKFIDGSTVTLSNLRPDEGVADPSGQTYAYRAQYAVDRLLLKKFRTLELDKIRLSWSTGYEDYEAYNIDALMRLTRCLLQTDKE